MVVSEIDDGIVQEAFLTQREATLGGGLGYFALKRIRD
jgi:hypothetical protein